MKKFVKVLAITMLFMMMTIVVAGCKRESKSTTTGKAATASKGTATVPKGSVTGTKTTAKTSASMSTAGDNNQDNDADQDNDSDDSDNDEEIPQQEEVINLNGKTIKVMTLFAIEAYLNPEVQVGAALISSIKEAEEKYNVKIVMEAGANSTTVRTDFTNATMAGLKFCDALNTTNTHAFPLALGKLILPIDKYVDFDNDPRWNFNAVRNLSLFKGQHWGFPLNTQNGMIGVGYMYNKDIFLNEGVRDPQDLMDEDNWNYSTFLDACINTTRDKNGDGIVDQYAITSAFDRFIMALLFSNSAQYTYFEGDRMMVDLSSKNVMNALQFGSDLCQIYKVVEPRTTGAALPRRNFNTWTEEFVAGRAAMMTTEGFNPAVVTSGINAGLVLLPKGPDTSDYFNVFTTAFFTIIPVTLESDPDADNIIKVMLDAFCSWDKSKSYWRENVESTDINVVPIAGPRDQKIINNYSRSINYIQEYGGIGVGTNAFNWKYNMAILGYLNGQTGFGMAAESIRAPLQTMLDEVINTGN